MTQERNFFTLSADGGIVAPPGQASGEAAIGVVLKDPDGSLIHEISTRIGLVEDHHVAEYRALIAGLRLARGHGIDDIRVFLDSTVVVKQVNGEASVKGAYRSHLIEGLSLYEEFLDIEIKWISRKENKEAHALADRALASLR